MHLADFDYHLPEELIAQEAAGRSRRLAHAGAVPAARPLGGPAFRELPEFLGAGDCLVLNDSRVFPARLFGHRAGVHSLPIGKGNPKRRENLSGAVEVFLLRAVSADGRDWEALVRPGRKMRVGERIRFEDGLEGEIVARGEFGERTVRFQRRARICSRSSKRSATCPCRPTSSGRIRRRSRALPDGVRPRKGSVAAPTAGLHFTRRFSKLAARAARRWPTSLCTSGWGHSSRSTRSEVEEGRLHSERYAITEENAAKMRAARRLVAVGTTSVRTIETAWETGALRGETDIFIYPGFEFRAAGRDAHELPSAAHQPAAAGVRLRRNRAGAGRLPARRRAAVPFLFLRRLHAGGVEPKGGSDLRRDLSFALRQLFKNRTFGAFAVLTIALAIGANTAIFSAIDAVLLHPVPYPNPDQLVTVVKNFSHFSRVKVPVSPPESLDFRSMATCFSSQGAVDSLGTFTLTGNGEPELVPLMHVTASIFPMLGVKPLIGGLFTEEEQFGKNHVAVISDRLWQRRYGSDASIIGKNIEINEESYRVVGVITPILEYRLAADAWIPLAFSPADLTPQRRGFQYIDVIGRLKSGWTIQQARLSSTILPRRFADSTPECTRRWLLTGGRALSGEGRM